MADFRVSQNGLEKVLEAYRQKQLDMGNYGHQNQYSHQIIADNAGLQRSRVDNFFNRKYLRPEKFKAICEELELDWEEIVEYPYKPSKPRPSTPPATSNKKQKNGLKNPILSSPYTQRFSAWIEDKTTRFVGRKYVFDAFKEFTERYDRGYFSVVGDPGEGKSAIAAKYVLENPCFYYFNRRRKGWTKTAQFLENICNQLIEHFKFKTSFSVELAKDGTFFQELLSQSSALLGTHEKLVIVIDALDEVDFNYHQNEKSTILYFPEEELPKNVYFLLTRRRDKQLEFLLPTNVPSEIFDFKEKFKQKEYEEKINDNINTYIKEYLEEVEDTNEVKTAINAQKSREKFFIDILREKSERNFMYLTLVLPQMIDGCYKNLILSKFIQGNLKDLKLVGLPKGLIEYYQHHWIQMGMVGENPPQEKIYIIYVMSQHKKPMTRDYIAELSAQSFTKVQWILDHWYQFLDRESLEEGDDEEIKDEDYKENVPTNLIGYAFYHESYNDFLYSQEIIQSAGVDLQKINAEIADRQVPPDVEF